MRARFTAFVMAVAFSATSWAAGELSNRRAPGFTLVDQDRRQHSLSRYRGKYAIVNIMNTGCPHCGTFSKILAEAEARYAGRLLIIDIVNPPDTPRSVQTYKARNRINQLMLFDCGQVTASYLFPKVVPGKPEINVPHFFLIDPKGWIVEDYGYNAFQKGIFEGEGLFEILKTHLGPPTVSSRPK